MQVITTGTATGSSSIQHSRYIVKSNRQIYRSHLQRRAQACLYTSRPLSQRPHVSIYVSKATHHNSGSMREEAHLEPPVISSVPTTPTIGNTTALQQDDMESEQPLLLQRVDATPTSSRVLHGLVDLLIMALVTVAFFIIRIFQFAGSSLRHYAKLPSRNLTTDPDFSSALASSLQSTVDSLQPGSARCIPKDLSQTASASPTILTDIDHYASAHELSRSFRAFQDAFDHCIQKFDLADADKAVEKLQSDLKDLVKALLPTPGVDCQDSINHGRRLFKKAIKSVSKQAAALNPTLQPNEVLKDFKFQVLIQRVRHSPSAMQKSLAVLPGGRELHERVVTIPLDLGVRYLELCSGSERHPLQVEFMKLHRWARPSAAKKEEQVQAMAINARYHSIGTVEGGVFTEVFGEMRSGAFATHGRRPRGLGLSELRLVVDKWGGEEVAAREEAARQLGLQNWGELEEEVGLREDWVVAQALPVICEYLRRQAQRKAALDSALRSGWFLYLQQSFLSDTDPNERAMLQDMRGALDTLTQRLSIRFTAAAPSPLQLEGSRLTLHLPLDLLPPPSRKEFEGRAFGLMGIVTSQGVNARQSLGFLRAGDGKPLYQDMLNRAAVDKLLNYAQSVGLHQEPALQSLAEHYSAMGVRSPKDLRGVTVLKEAVLALGGARTVVCKSGKDRTAMELSWSLSAEAVKTQLVSPSSQAALRSSLHKGLSYCITGVNNGHLNAYAFNLMELVTLPPGWAPSWRLCASIET